MNEEFVDASRIGSTVYLIDHTLALYLEDTRVVLACCASKFPTNTWQTLAVEHRSI